MKRMISNPKKTWRIKITEMKVNIITYIKSVGTADMGYLMPKTSL